MSIQAVGWALDQDVGDPAAKLVLIALANAFNQQHGRCFPTVHQIARNASISERSVVRKLKHLADLGWIQVVAAYHETGRQQANEYLLTGFSTPAGGCQVVTPPCGRVPVCQGGEDDSSVRGEGDTCVREEGDSCVTPLKEPEEIPEERTGRVKSARSGRGASHVEPANDDTPMGALCRVLDLEHAKQVVDHRRVLRKPLTAQAAVALAAEFAKVSDPNAAVAMMLRRGWQGFEAKWMEDRPSHSGPAGAQLVPNLHRKSGSEIACDDLEGMLARSMGSTEETWRQDDRSTIDVQATRLR